MTQVEIESILQHEDIQALLENSESTGSVRQTELAELIELHQLDALETDALFTELDRRGIEIVEDLDKEKEPEPEPAPLPLQTSYERSEEHTSELQSLTNLVCRLLLEKKKRHTLHIEHSHPIWSQ